MYLEPLYLRTCTFGTVLSLPGNLSTALRPVNERNPLDLGFRPRQLPLVQTNYVQIPGISLPYAHLWGAVLRKLKINWKRVGEIAWKSAAVLACIWLAGVIFFNYAMHQTPERFGRIMSRTPVVAFITLPFETLWTRARAGTVQPGDLAPDFTLPTLDKSAHVQLSSFRDKQPVVLVFGSYT